jgi:signal transduction histidine kinase
MSSALPPVAVSADRSRWRGRRVRRAADYRAHFRGYRRRVGRFAVGQVDQRTLDRAAAVVLLAVGWIEAFTAPAGTSRWAQACLAVAYAVPLAWRRRWPVPVLAVVAILGPTLGLANSQGGIMSYVLAMILAAFTVGRQLDPPAAWLGPAFTVGFFWLASAVTGQEIDNYFFTALIYGGAWGAGYAICRREADSHEVARQADDLKRQVEDERLAVTQERTRIARELHDIVSHSISVITIQTQAVRKRIGPEHAAEIDDLHRIEGTARQAMAEMRRLLGVLRTEDDPLALAPQPGLDQLPRLIADTRSAGVPVELRITGEPAPLPPGVDLAAYRIVQEALTNVRKHAAGTRATVVLRYGDGGLVVSVDDDGPDSPSGSDHPGHGLIGMRERIALYGGTVHAGRKPAGGFSVHATLPVGPTVAA